MATVSCRKDPGKLSYLKRPVHKSCCPCPQIRGRSPNYLLERIHSLTGNGMPAVGRMQTFRALLCSQLIEYIGGLAGKHVEQREVALGRLVQPPPMRG